MSEFKKHPFIPWYMSDWLNDPQVRTLKAEHKGFWIDLICQMALFFPYGHCSKLSIQKLKKVKLKALKNFSVEDLVNQNSNPGVKGGVDPWVVLSVALSVEEQLEVCENLEDQLHLFLPYSKEEVQYHIKAIEEDGVCSRTSSGIIYNRRLVRDFKRRVTNYKNGKKGGNPYIRKFKEENQDYLPEPDLLDKSVNQISNHVAGNMVKASLDTDTIVNKVGNDNRIESLKEGGPGETIQREGKEDFPLIKLYRKTYQEIRTAKNVGDRVTEKGFALWKEFVDMVYAENMTEIFKAKFLNPNEFEEVCSKHSFKKEKWVPVLRRILSTGIKPEHTLYFRIPEFIKYVYKDQNASDLHTGNESFEDMQKW